MILLLLFLDLKIENLQNLNLVGSLVSEILVFKLISICKFQNDPCALGFEEGLKHSKYFCTSSRTHIIILSMDFTICQNNLFVVKCIFKIIIRVLKLLQKNFECFTSNPNSHETFWNLHITINKKVNISDTNGQLNWNLVCFLFPKSRIFSTKMTKFWQLIVYGNFSTGAP